MLPPGLAVAALAAFALTATAAMAQPALTAEAVIARILEEPTTLQRETWFNTNAKGKTVAWTAPVFNVTPSFSIVLVNTRPTERGLIACQVPEKLHATAKKLQSGETVLCAGRIESYETLMGAALINVTANAFIVGKEKIDAWEKAQKKSNP
jgi:hypothetical protein